MVSPPGGGMSEPLSRTDTPRPAPYAAATTVTASYCCTSSYRLVDPELAEGGGGVIVGPYRHRGRRQRRQAPGGLSPPPRPGVAQRAPYRPRRRRIERRVVAVADRRLRGTQRLQEPGAGRRVLLR